MEAKVEPWKVERLIRLHDDGVIYPNHEFQRGARWSDAQIRLFIDSVLRGYQIPMMYFRKVRKGDEQIGGSELQIIDGQQRINALSGFKNNYIRRPGQAHLAFKPLYDPRDEEGDFPVSLKGADCPWAGKTYDNLSEDMRRKFLNTKIPVAIMEDPSEDGVETRDLFVRLQGGVALKPQEIRDSWPGEFCKIVRKIGGMVLDGEEGDQFFRKLVASPRKDRGEIRQLVAQLLVFFLRKHEEGKNGDYFVGITPTVLDDYYRRYVGLSADCPVIQRFLRVMSELLPLFKDARVGKFSRQEAIHIVLLADKLMEEYAPTWKEGIGSALRQFSSLQQKAKEIRNLTGEEDEDIREAWLYTQMMSKGGADIIRQRHAIYERCMLKFLGDLAEKAKR